MGKFKTSWSLFKSSLSVIAKNKILLVFPVVEFISILIIGILFLSPIFLWDSGHSITDVQHWEALGKHFGELVENEKAGGAITVETLTGKNWFVWFAVFYFISMFVATFFNVAFYNEIIKGLNGKRVSFFRGITAAFLKIKLIMVWSLFAGIVGMVIRTIEERLGFVGRWIMGLIGLAWSVASIFIIPVIIREEKSANPVKLLKTSAVMLKRTWGETIIGYAGISGFYLLILFISLPLLIAVCYIMGNTIPHIAGVIFVLICLYIIFMLILAYLSGVANHVLSGCSLCIRLRGCYP